MVVMIDNYDSFTYNLVQYFGELGCRVTVFRNDAVTLDKLRALKPRRLIISPGPGGPEDAGISCEAIRAFAGRIPLLGVCLGHQCLGHVFGGKVVGAPVLMHGKTSQIYHNAKTIFKGLSDPFTATRYHSLVVEKKSLPDCLEVIAYTKDGQIMGLKHRRYAAWGVQFHPESIMTSEGKQLLGNFLKI
jgi:anthranilate synthase/aminodeoxychorismate synthase-like glutamine amidotransferase